MKRLLKKESADARPSGRRCFLLFFLVLFSAAACNRQKESRQFRIGFSQCVESDVWRKTMLEEMKRELSFHTNARLLYRQADGNSDRQIEQVNELLKEGIDLLIISPNEAEPLTGIVDKTFRQGIPVIVVDRKISTANYSAYVGGNNYEIGKLAGEYTAKLLNGKGRIVEVTGLPKSSPAMERQQGFADVLKNYPAIAVVEKLNGEWLKEVAQKRLAAAVAAHPDVDLVFAHNDRMALGSYEVYKNSTAAVPRIIGVDGLAAKNAGLDLVNGKVLTATILYPTGGQEAIMTAVDILEGRPYKKENPLFTTIIDSTNVRILKLQNEKTLAQQADIDRRQQTIEQQLVITRNQTNAIYAISVLLVLALALGLVTYYYLRENKKINRQLTLQNDEISRQRNELIEMSAKAKAANDAKVNFFTNISHEFRTPLTLILGSLEELAADKKAGFATRQNLALIQKNALRLLRLFNQLIDFRKIEAEKMKLRATENDLVLFLSEIVDAYKSVAKKRNVDLRLVTGEGRLPAWFDVNMLDKVIFNLLSNAFKFTADNGFVHLHVSKTPDGKAAVVKVQDNGVGISKAALAHTFEPFYQGDFENYKGSGLGLALSKELIQSHAGSITVQSEKGKGTAFTVVLPLGRTHLKPEETMSGEDVPARLYEHEKIFLEDDESGTAPDVQPIQNGQEHSVLLIEDNTDLRRFLATRLRHDYEIAEAADGQSALRQAFDLVPDLIITDVIIPGKDGMELTAIFKADVRTSHIPVIILTAKTATEQQIKGMKSKADVYITKPFNLTFLEETIKSLLDNRAKLKEHYTSELPLDLKSQALNKVDRKFIHEFTSLVESNIDNEDFSADDICKSIGISRVQLYRKIKALLDISVNDYILNTRLQKAKYLLQNEGLTIAEVAFRVGFSTPAYFSTVFKSKFGLTPKAYKGHP